MQGELKQTFISNLLFKQLVTVAVDNYTRLHAQLYCIYM